MKNKPRIAAGMAALAALVGYATTFLASPASSTETSSRPPACAAPTGPIGQPATSPSALKPTTIDTIEQAYYCILDNYYSGSVLDDRTLLVPAFAALTQELVGEVEYRTISLNRPNEPGSNARGHGDGDTSHDGDDRDCDRDDQGGVRPRLGLGC